MMNIDEFRESFINEIESEAYNEHEYPVKVFLKKVEDILVYDYSVLSQIDPCYFDLPYEAGKHKRIHIDGAYFEESSNTLHLVSLDYNNGPMVTMTKSNYEDRLKYLKNYFDAVLTGYFKTGERSDPAVQYSYTIRHQLANNNIFKVNYIIATTNKFVNSCSIVEAPKIMIGSNEISINQTSLDIGAIYKTKLAGFEKDPVNVVTEEFGVKGLQCIKANLTSSKYEAYLVILPGKFLSSVYDKYGSRLLEDNVRSFLNFKGSVNKGIRDTIRNSPEDFFAFNNGISATASDVNIEYVEGEGYLITEIDNFQIINGGQTTASITTTMHKDKADLDNIFVQMKLTRTFDRNEKFIRNVAKFANSQNKVTNADLNSNHEFYIRMENFSRKLYTPRLNNSTLQTLWFFERSRGQYDSLTVNMKKSQIDVFKTQNPPSQKITKTDLAKYMNSSMMKPYYVSWGAEVNATRFFTWMEADWEKNETSYNELFYKRLVGMAILFKYIEKTISNTDWYQERNGYRAQLVTYTFSKLVYEASKKKLLIDYLDIWNKQEVPELYKVEIENIAKICFDNFYNPMIANIGTYCKKKETWDIIKETNYTLSDDVYDLMISPEEEKIAEVSAKKEQRENNQISIEIEIFNIGKSKWESLKEEGVKEKVLNQVDVDLLNIAIKFSSTGSGMSPKQAKAIMKVKEKLNDNCIR